MYEKVKETCILDRVEKEGNIFHAENAFKANQFLHFIKDCGLDDKSKTVLLQKVPGVMDGNIEIKWRDGEPIIDDKTI